MQRSPSREEAFGSSSSSPITDHHHHHHHVDCSPTNNTDSESRVIFADPCSMCGTKKRRVCLSPLHQNVDPRPRKKLFTEPSPSSSTFQANSVCQVSFPTPSPTPTPTHPPPPPSPETSSKKVDDSPESGSLRSSSGKGKKIMNELEEDSYESDDSPEKSPPPAVHHRRVSFSPSRSTAKESPAASASLPPRPPKQRRSTPTPAPAPTPTPSPDRVSRRGGLRSPASVASASDSETRSREGTPQDKESWKTMKELMGLMNTLLASGIFNAPQKEKIQETIHGKKGILEISDEDHILKGERGVYKGTCQCICGKTYQMILSILPE